MTLPTPDWETLEAKFWPHVPVRVEGQCWLWEGAYRGFYGVFWMDGKWRPAHKVTWELAHRQRFREDRFALHRCHVKKCVNPTHIYVGTKADNMNDVYDTGWVHWARRKTHCKRGHPLSGDNVYLSPGKRGPRRSCKTCQRNRERERRAAIRAAVVSGTEETP